MIRKPVLFAGLVALFGLALASPWVIRWYKDAQPSVSVREHVDSVESVVIQGRRLGLGEAADVDAGKPWAL
jgi:hypothetical protein